VVPVIIAALDDADTINKIVALGESLGLSVVLSSPSHQAAQDIPWSRGPRLLVIDMDSRRGGGLVSLQRVRLYPDILVIVVGDRPDNARAIAALGAGADCYLPKPVDAALLRAHVEALLRRWHRVTDRPESVTVRGLTVDFARKEVSLNGEPVPLTPAEFRLLACLASRPGKVVSSSELLKEISGYDCPEAEAQEIVKVHISRLRAKIDRDEDSPSYILNVRGFGYILERRGPSTSLPS